MFSVPPRLPHDHEDQLQTYLLEGQAQEVPSLVPYHRLVVPLGQLTSEMFCSCMVFDHPYCHPVVHHVNQYLKVVLQGLAQGELVVVPSHRPPLPLD